MKQQSESIQHDLLLRKAALREIEAEKTGYPSVDKPWLKYYSEEALRQVEEKNYQAILESKGIHKERIRKCGFALCGKTVLIGEGLKKTHSGISARLHT